MADNYTPLIAGDQATAALFNGVFDEFDDAIGNLSTLNTTVQTSTVGAINEVYADIIGVLGGPDATDQQLIDWAEAEAYQMLEITYHGTYVTAIAEAIIEWPDGSGGEFTTTTTNATWWAVDAYTVTHTDSTKTVTQAAVTRNSDGEIEIKPPLTVG